MKITSEHLVQTSNHHLSNDCEAIFVVDNEIGKVEINVNWYIDGYSKYHNLVNIHIDSYEAILESNKSESTYKLDPTQAKELFNALSEAVNDNPVENGLPHYLENYN
jgi:hypothetical protein